MILAVENERSPLWSGNAAATEEQKGRIVKAALYGIQVFYSFFIMWVSLVTDVGGVADLGRLLFMTYNGWIMLAVGVGAFIGYLMFGGSSVSKSAACH